ncbi:MAG: Rieske 2Fe-2S domain-containing protein, partial [Chloroflexota bacterium]
TLGLIDEPCPHRRVSLEYGIPEVEGLRCPYHGWLFNHEGRCTEQPAEPWNSTFKERITTKAYPVQALGGLIFAYLGPQPAPLLPRYDLFVWDNVVRQAGVTLLPCSYLQCMENSMDPVHAEWLHGYYMDYVWSRKGQPIAPRFRARHKKIGFDRFDHGIIKRRVVEGGTEEDHAWSVGHPVVFPYTLKVSGTGGYNFQIRVPVDDTHTLHWYYSVYRPGIPISPQTSVPVYDIPFREPSGGFLTDFIIGQDMFAWVSQGAVTDREREHLGQSDIGVIMYRELLKAQLEVGARGEDPMEVYRDPAQNRCIVLPQEEALRVFFEREREMSARMRYQGASDKHGPLRSMVTGLFAEAEARLAGGEPLLPPIEPPGYPVGYMEHRSAVLIP